MERQTDLGEVIDRIGAQPVTWLRAGVVSGDGDSWTVRLLEVVSGSTAPPSWEQRSWEYPNALFAGVRESGETVADWLRARTLRVGAREASLPELLTRVPGERRQSHATAPYETLPWPTTEETLAQIAPANEPPGMLVSTNDAPSFVNFYAAAAYCFGLDRQPVGGSLHQRAMYRHQDERARINRVRIAGDRVEVEIEGDAIDGMAIELAGEVPGPTERVWARRERTASVTFSLDNGLPPGAWLLLRHQGEWVDRRFLQVPWVQGHEVGVEVVVESATKLEAFLAGREGPRTEFKRHIPTDREGKARTMKTVCAFANGDGGSLLFGIDDDHTVLGVRTQQVDRLKDDLTQVVGSWVEPRPGIDFDSLPTSDGDAVVLELRVAPGRHLYGCGRPGEEARTAYVRHYATTVPARPNEIEQIVRSRLPGEAVPPWVAR